MSKQPDSGSDSAPTTEPTGSFSTNGTHDGAVATAAPEAPVTDAESTEQSGATGETEVPAAEATVAEASAEAAASAESSTVSDDPASFLGELVRAMQTTAVAERARIAADTDRRREEHLAAIQARRETEAATMRSLAADDLKSIDSWADQERQRIKTEREKRASALDDDLKKSLSEHGSKIDREVEAVEAAISAYRVEVEAFFAELDRETDPVAIARQAGKRPAFPTLEQPVAADAAAVAAAGEAAGAVASPAAETPAADAAEPTPVAVMDANPGSKLAASFPSWDGSKPAEAPAEAQAEAVAEAPAEPATAEAQAPSESGETGVPVASAGEILIGEETPSDAGTLLHAVPSGRPLSWLRRGNDSSDRPNG